jgi:hypothetical protein
MSTPTCSATFSPNAAAVPERRAITDSISTFNLRPFTGNRPPHSLCHNSYFIEQWIRDYYLPGANPYRHGER